MCQTKAVYQIKVAHKTETPYLKVMNQDTKVILPLTIKTKLLSAQIIKAILAKIVITLIITMTKTSMKAYLLKYPQKNKIPKATFL